MVLLKKQYTLVTKYFVVGKDYLPFDTEHFIDKVDLEKKELILSELGAGIFEWL